MADFCRQCSTSIFREDFKDLAGISTERDTSKGLFASVLCEGCGSIQVDHVGTCVSLDCYAGHTIGENRGGGVL